MSHVFDSADRCLEVQQAADAGRSVLLTADEVQAMFRAVRHQARRARDLETHEYVDRIFAALHADSPGRAIKTARDIERRLNALAKRKVMSRGVSETDLDSNDAIGSARAAWAEVLKVLRDVPVRIAERFAVELREDIARTMGTP